MIIILPFPSIAVEKIGEPGGQEYLESFANAVTWEGQRGARGI